MGRADREGLVQDTAERAAAPDAAEDTEGTAAARGRGEPAGIAADVPAEALGAPPTAVPWPLAAPRPDTTTAVATEPTMSSRARASHVLAPGPAGMTSLSLARLPGRP